MAANQIGNDATTTNKIDRTAPAGSENSLGEESVRDGRPQPRTTWWRRSTKRVPALPLPHLPTTAASGLVSAMGGLPGRP